ncbi:DUF3048 domain-containing protein [Actinophytocola oryzae]|uniref:DUF3048 family protein n=1 Tax=Actinophytocola oryzae TaxID=502181 RepID=A0A4R7V5D1_9PSEU|nr:DUF3048 domain-containing protein [Actinophytocola oryzae]TDV44140.1 Protein of unknown function (DUF3048) [Actinophytocola oryzae]
MGTTRRQPRKWLVWEIVTTLFVVTVVAGVLVAVERNGDSGNPGAPPAPPATSRDRAPASTEPAPFTAPALVVKIDNVPAARPATGLGAADVVYVEPVEAGLTRLVAVYTGTPPAVVGPVRSARLTDVELLAQYGRPALAYSGAAPELLPALHAADVVDASPARAASAFYRDRGRRAPHNLYVRPARLPGGARGPAVSPLLFGPAPDTGTPTATYRVGYPAATFAFTWSAAVGLWSVSLNGTPLCSTDTGRVGAATVVWQRVQVTSDRSPVAHTVGAGDAVVLRDGRQFTGTWSRPTPRSPTTFRLADRLELPLAPGQTWVLLTA